MKTLKYAVLLAAGITWSSISVADDGVEKAADGTVKAVTAPAEVVKGMDKEMKDKGATGVVTGSVKGGANAAEQAVEGAADVATGVVETILEPLTGDD